MAYGILKVDTITFTDGGVDKSVPVSGLVQNPTFTGNITATGTISGDIIKGGTTVSGVTVIATTGTFTSLTGTTTNGTTASFTTGNFTSLTGTTTTGTTATFASGVFTTQVSGVTVIATTGTFTSLTGTTTNGTTASFTTGNFTSLTGTTTTGTTANFASGVFTTQVSGVTVIATTGTSTSLTGTTTTMTSGVFASGTEPLPSISFVSDPNTGIYSPGADQLAVATNGVERVEFGTAEVVFNDGGTDYDFRVEGDTSSHLLFVDASTDRVGIGSSSPEGKLTVAGTAAEPPSSGTTANSLLQLKDATNNNELNMGLHTVTGNYGAYIQASDNNLAVPYGLHLQPKGGNVGIGTTSPTDTNGFGTCIDIRSSTGAAIYLRDSDDTTNDTFVIGRDNSDSYLSSNSGNIVISNNGSERARIDSSGRMLVGTSSAFDTGYVGNSYSVGVETVSAYTSIALKTNSSNAEGTYIVLGKARSAALNSKAVVQSGDTLGAIVFEGADGTTMQRSADIRCVVDGTPGANDMPGRLVFSTTPDSGSSPTAGLILRQNRNLELYTNGGSGLDVATQRAASTSDQVFIGRHGATDFLSGTTSINIFTNGDLKNTNNSYTGISDIKLKENIVDASSQWNDLKSLQVRKYNFKEETGHQTHTQLGLIAQEVEEVSPGLVGESPDRDAEGNDLGTVTKSVNYSVLYMKAVKALQEAMGRIETLEQRLTAAGID